ncbi:hypothetical protein ABBQ38_004125 [Trebouxia sp. C0009 RCD-2024]
MQSVRHACSSCYALAAYDRQPAAFRGDVQKFDSCPGISSRNCHSSNTVRTFKHLTCCSKSQHTQPGISRKALKGALQEAARTEGGYLTKLLIVSAIGAAGVKFGSLLISTPFQPSGIIALSIITIPCLMFSALLLTR